MPVLDRILEEKLAALAAKGLQRQLHPDEAVLGLRAFSGNDYLGLRLHPKVMRAAREALAQRGVGAGASRLVTGNHPFYKTVEDRLAAMKRVEAALVFGSGYLANMGVIPALVGKGDLILADRLVHASMLAGARLSGAKLLRFAHNDLAHAAHLLAEHRAAYRYCLVMTETVFSMDGDRAPVTALHRLAQAHDAWLLTDDAHGLGVLPGDLRQPADIHLGTLSKAVGAYGGYVCGSRALVDYLIAAAPTLIYSTALPPAVLAAADAALEIIASQPELCALPLAQARRFTALLGLPEAESAIVPLVMGSAEAALRASALLAREGFLVKAFRPPTVPEGTARLRFTFSAAHRGEDIERLAAIVKREGWAS